MLIITISSFATIFSADCKTIITVVCRAIITYDLMIYLRKTQSAREFFLGPLKNRSSNILLSLYLLVAGL